MVLESFTKIKEILEGINEGKPLNEEALQNAIKYINTFYSNTGMNFGSFRYMRNREDANEIESMDTNIKALLEDETVENNLPSGMSKMIFNLFISF